jgi:MFS family permease
MKPVAVTRPLSFLTDAALRVLARAVAKEAPAAARVAFSREVAATFFIMLAMATIEGGVIAVFAKQTFAETQPKALVNVLIGLLAAMGELANILSFFWTSVSHGRPKVAVMTVMYGVIVACIALIALLPATGMTGLIGLLVLVLAARVCWSGIITLRPTLWRANYPRDVRMRAVGVLSGIQVACVAGIGLALGATLDKNPEAYRVFLPGAAACALVGVWIFAGTRVRHEAKQLSEERAENADRVMKPWHGPLAVWEILHRDRWYAQFMLWMFVLGFGNLMVMPTMVISLKDDHGLGYLQSVLITSSVPCIVTLIAIPLWRRYLDRAHVVRFRAVHSWVFVLASIFYTIGAWTHALPWYFAAAATMGIGFGGGSLAWNLGHVDFARPSETSKYMATHVTLNGIRGLIAPLAVASSYDLLKARGIDAHLWIQVFGLVISIIGAAGFVHLRVSMGKMLDKRVER